MAMNYQMKMMTFFLVFAGCLGFATMLRAGENNLLDTPFPAEMPLSSTQFPAKGAAVTTTIREPQSAHGLVPDHFPMAILLVTTLFMGVWSVVGLRKY